LISKQEVIHILREIIYEVGENYSYPRQEVCQYFDNEELPSCLLGHLFYKFDIKINDDYNFRNFYGLPKEIKNRFSQEAQFLLQKAQVLQDANEKWVDAVNTAIRELDLGEVYIGRNFTTIK
jgi:hypothetical protein